MADYKMGSVVVPENTALGKAMNEFIDSRRGKEKPPDAEPIPAEEILNTPPDDFETVLEQAKASAELTYEDRLREQGIALEEARLLVNALIEKGHFEKTYSITSRVSVTFRTRRVRDNNSLLDELEKRTYGYQASIANHHTRYNLAASLVSIGPTNKLTRFDTDDIEHTLKFLDALPVAYYALLVEKLIRFDRLVAAVLEEGAVQNF